MARMLPPCFDSSTVSAAERRLFDLIKNDPGTKDWVVLHSLGLARRGRKPYGEIDFVLLIPGGGVFCLEVKGGRVACRNGEWETTDRQGRTTRLKRSPFMQAREGMFAVKEAVQGRVRSGLPRDLVFGYAVVMPDIEFNVESPEWEGWQAIDRRSLSQPVSVSMLHLVSEQRRLVSARNGSEPTPACIELMQHLLRPDFEVIVTKAAQLQETDEQLLRLTEEQYAALDLLADNDRCLFEGAAGTGKTVLALEFARRAAGAGRRTLLVCFNRFLGDWLSRQTDVGDHLVAGRFYQLVREAVLASSFAQEFLEQERECPVNELFAKVYPRLGRLAVEESNCRFESVVIDEAQDLLCAPILDVLDVWMDGGLAGGRWAAFGDFHRQAIFSGASRSEIIGLLQNRSNLFVRGRLTVNCRNTRNIGEETSLMSGFSSLPYRLGNVLGPPVDYRYYTTPDSQSEALTVALHQLLDGGVRSNDIVVLSRLKLANSGVTKCAQAGAVPLTEAVMGGHLTPGAVQFSTIQAFKGLESPVVVLCDVDNLSEGDTQSLLYVAMSRARCQLIVLLHEATRPYVLDRIRSKLIGGFQ